MKYYYSIVVIFLTTLSLFGVLEYVNPSVYYDQITFLTAHNAYAAKQHGYLYAQQHLSITEQLNFGVRGLMLDTHYSCSKLKKRTVNLCHRNHITNRYICKGKPRAFCEALEDIAVFLQQHPSEIVTIFLENYVYDGDFLDKAISSSTIASLILKPHEWNAHELGWPTIGWMQRSNKRVVIFNSVGETHFTYPQWEHVIENQFGVTNIYKASFERKESKKCRNYSRNLYLLNYFPTMQFNYGGVFYKINSCRLKNFLSSVYGTGLLPGNLYRYWKPNFIAVDYIEQGDAAFFVNFMNQYDFYYKN